MHNFSSSIFVDPVFSCTLSSAQEISQLYILCMSACETADFELQSTQNSVELASSKQCADYEQLIRHTLGEHHVFHYWKRARKIPQTQSIIRA